MLPLTCIIPVILAAGDSTRMGYPKALLPLKSGTFLTHILETVKTAGLGKPVVVLGRSAPAIQSQVEPEQVDTIINPDPDRGQLSSLQLALGALRPDCVGAMIWPVDQPLVSVKLVMELAQLFLASGILIANPVCDQKRGHPVIFRRDLFPEFMETPLDEGPKNIVSRYQQDTATLVTEEIGTVMDIDTPEDYENAFGLSLDLLMKT